jgi:hypothetical protein
LVEEDLLCLDLTHPVLDLAFAAVARIPFEPKDAIKVNH